MKQGEQQHANENRERWVINDEVSDECVCPLCGAKTGGEDE